MQRGYPDGSLRTKSEVSQVNASLRDKARRKSGGTGITTGQGLTAYVFNQADFTSVGTNIEY